MLTASARAEQHGQAPRAVAWAALRRALASQRAHVALVGATALAVRLAFLYRAPIFLTGDSQSHFLPGFDLATGLGFDPELRRTPGYAAFVAATITLLGEDLRALAFAQHLVGVATAMLACFLGRLAFGATAGLVAGLLVALDGALVLSEHSVMTEALFGALVVAVVLALVVATRGRQRRMMLAVGILLGLASLTRPVGQILVPVALGAVALSATVEPRGAPRLRAAAVGSGLVALGFLVVVGPWMLRNLAEHGSLTASGGLGRSLVARTIKYDFGYFESDRPVVEGDLKSEVRQFVRGKRNTIRNSRSVRSTQAGLMRELGLTEAQSDSLMRQVALDEIAERPGYYLLGSVRMAWQILAGREKDDAFGPRWSQRAEKDWVEQWETRVDHLLAPPTPGEEHEMARAEWLTTLYQPTDFGPLIPALALLGLAAAAAGLPPDRSGLVVGAAMLALVLTSAALDGPVPRYRYPVDPLLAVLAAGGAGSVLALARGQLQARRGRLVAREATG